MQDRQGLAREPQLPVAAFCSVIVVSRNSSLTFRSLVRTVFVRKLNRDRQIQDAETKEAA